MEGSDGTVYGWVEYTYDENGNKRRHIYLNDEVLARMIGDRFVRKQKTEPHSEFRFLF